MSAHDSARPLASAAPTSVIASPARGLTDELLDDVRRCARAVIERRIATAPVASMTAMPFATSLADEIARNTTAVVIAILEERGML